MKKSSLNLLALLLTAALVMQCALLPVSAETPTDAASQPVAQTDPTESKPDASSIQAEFGSVSILQGCRTIDGMVPLSGSERRLETAQSVFVFDTKTQTVVYSYNPDMKMSPGTLAKLVTALVVLESTQLDDVVVCHSKNISRLPGGTQNVKLKELEELTVEQLLYCLILHGANDAAIAWSEHITGNQESILNLSLTEGMRTWIIRPDAMPAEENSPHEAAPSETEPAGSSAGSGDTDNYLSGVEAGDNRVYSDGKGTGQDKYLTDPIPEGRPMPVEPEDQNIDKGKSFPCTFSIECSTILNNLSDLDPEKL